MRKSLILLILLFCLSLLGCSSEQSSEKSNRKVDVSDSGVESIPIEEDQERKDENTFGVVIGNITYTAEIHPGPAAVTFKELLPLTLDMTELNGNEKYAYLTENIPQDNSVTGEIRTGDIMLFGADCLVLFYKDFATDYSYTPIGRIVDPKGLAEALGEGTATVSFQ